MHSIVRETMGTGFPGGTYRQLFYVADVEASGPAIDGELHVDLDEADFLAVFPLAGKGRARLIGTVRDERAEHADTLKFEDVSRRIIDNLKVEVEKVNWFSTYHVHHRVTEHFRKGRAFLLGDAAHIHSPAGGQGMNTGIGDAINLAWKLQRFLPATRPTRCSIAMNPSASRSHAGWSAPRTAYSALRPPRAGRRHHSHARRADRVSGVGKIRSSSANSCSGPCLRSPSTIVIAALSEGHAGDVHGGDRLPWVMVEGSTTTIP